MSNKSRWAPRGGTDDREAFIPIPRDALVAQLATHLETTNSAAGNSRRRADWMDFTTSINFTVMTFYSKMSERMRGYFDGYGVTSQRLLAMGAGSNGAGAGKPGPNSSSGSPTLPRLFIPPDHKKDAKWFLKDLFVMLAAAQYEPLSEGKYNEALDHEYEFTVPMEVQWQMIDNKVLQEVYQERGGYGIDGVELGVAQDDDSASDNGSNDGGDDRQNGSRRKRQQLEVPQFARHVGVFTRGKTVVEQSGYFIVEKINLLLDNVTEVIVHNTVSRVWGMLTSLVSFRKGKSRRRQTKRGGSNGASPVDANGDGEDASSEVSETSEEELLTLKQFMAEHGWLKGLFKSATLREPVFSRVIIVYLPKSRKLGAHDTSGLLSSPGGASARGNRSVRLARKTVEENGEVLNDSITSSLEDGADDDVLLEASSEDDSSNEGHASANPSGSRAPDIKSRGPKMVVEEYEGVPAGDLECLLPYKKIGFKSLDATKMIIQVLALIGFVAYVVLPMLSSTADASTTTSVLLSVLLVGVATKVLSLFTLFTYTTSMYKVEIDQWLQRHRAGNGPAVVTSLLDDVVFQEAKEILLGYFFLWIYGPLTQDQLDSHVEKFLEVHFGVDSNFEVVDSLNKLESMGLVTTRAVPTAGGSNGDGNANGNKPRNRRRSGTGDSGGATSETVAYCVTMTPKEWINRYPVEHLLARHLR